MKQSGIIRSHSCIPEIQRSSSSCFFSSITSDIVGWTSDSATLLVVVEEFTLSAGWMAFSSGGAEGREEAIAAVSSKQLTGVDFRNGRVLVNKGCLRRAKHELYEQQGRNKHGSCLHPKRS